MDSEIHILAEGKVDRMDRDERSLLLYLECRAVDAGGMVRGEQMNETDFSNARRWTEAGFVRFARIPSAILPKARACQATNVVELTPLAWECAAIERRRRAERSQNKEIVQPSLEHFEALMTPAAEEG